MSLPLPLVELMNRPPRHAHPGERVLRGAVQVVERATSPEQENWEDWLGKYFPDTTRAGFAPRHRRLWDWFEALEPGTAPTPDVEIWPRGGAKSTTAELGVVRTGERQRRKFALYVCATQAQSNKHVQSIGKLFERRGIERATNRYGNSLGWRMDLLRVVGGFSVLALGLDAAGRGVKLDDFRPDLIIFDDIDGRHDSDRVVKKKIETITDTILPMGSADAAVLVVQNRIHKNSIVSQIADRRADFLHSAQVHEDVAVRGLEIEGETLEDGRRQYRVKAGTATWAGQDLATVEHQINTWGRVAFLREAQHDLRVQEGGLWKRERDIDPFRIAPADLPELIKIGVGVDPNASSGNDEAGIIVAGIAEVAGVLHGYILEDATTKGGPATWAKEAVAAYRRWNGNLLVGEANNGGDMVAITISTVAGAPRVELVHASRGKLTRAEPVQKLAEDGRLHLVGHFPELETECCTWKPGEPSPGRMDAKVWIITKLMLTTEMMMPHTPGRRQEQPEPLTAVERGALQYVVNAGRATVDLFDEDHEPIGLMLRQRLVPTYMVITNRSGVLRLTQAGRAALAAQEDA